MTRRRKDPAHKQHKRLAHRISQLPTSPPPSADEVKPPSIAVFAYSEGELEEKMLTKPEDVAAYKDREATVWINVSGLGQAGAVEKICELYHVHPLIIEDILSPRQRPKLEVFDDYLSMVFKVLRSEGESEVVPEQVSLVLGRGYVLSFEERPGEGAFEAIRMALRTRKGKLRKLGADYLAYALLDSVVDSYYGILETLSEKVEILEDEVLDAPARSTLTKLHGLRNEIIFLRKSVWPLREVLERLAHDADDLIQHDTEAYLRDVHDHTVQIMEQIEVMREIVSGMLEIYLSTLSYNLNGVLKRLTIITTVFMPLSVLAGIGGMSEWTMMTGQDNWRVSYPLFLLGLALIGALTYLFFKLKKWA